MEKDIKEEGIKEEGSAQLVDSSLLSRIKRCKDNRRIAEVEIEEILPHRGPLQTELNPRIKLQLLGKLRMMSGEEICSYYGVKIEDMQKWSGIYEACGDNENKFIEYYGKKHQKRLSREQKCGIVEECRKGGEFQPGRISGLYGLSLYDLDKWNNQLKINNNKEEYVQLISKSQLTKEHRMRILLDTSIIGEDAAAIKYDIEKDTLLFWKQRYKIFGEKGLQFRTGQIVQFTPEEKVKVLECFKTHGAKYTSNKFGVYKRSLYRWKKYIKKRGGPVEYLSKIKSEEEKMRLFILQNREKSENKNKNSIIEEEYNQAKIENNNGYCKMGTNRKRKKKLRIEGEGEICASLQQPIYPNNSYDPNKNLKNNLLILSKNLEYLQRHLDGTKNSDLYLEYQQLIILLKEMTPELLPSNISSEFKNYLDTILTNHVNPALAVFNNS